MIKGRFFRLAMSWTMGLTGVLGVSIVLQNLSPSRANPPVDPPLQTRAIAKLQDIAEAITLKVISGDNSGSGIIVRRQGEVYTLVTNQHVLRSGNEPYRVQTPDGEEYEAWVVREESLEQYDLSVLEFYSDRDYAVARLGNSTEAALDETVFAAGFPFEADAADDRGFRFTMGQIRSIGNRAFNGGYQIGYTNAIKKGMSGGPVLNQRGEAIAINGVHAHPLWGNPYVFEDGSAPSESVFQEMSQLSWAIPMETLLQRMPELTENEAVEEIEDVEEVDRPEAEPPILKPKPRLTDGGSIVPNKKPISNHEQ
jgi:S1-C subfamily serine protease